MTQQTNPLPSPGSIAGTGLIGLGTFFLYEDAAGLLARLTHLLDAHGAKALGTLPAVALSTWQVYGADYSRFLEDLLVWVWIASWPWLLVLGGTILSRSPSRTIPGADQKQK